MVFRELRVGPSNFTANRGIGLNGTYPLASTQYGLRFIGVPSQGNRPYVVPSWVYPGSIDISYLVFHNFQGTPHSSRRIRNGSEYPVLRVVLFTECPKQGFVSVDPAIGIDIRKRQKLHNPYYNMTAADYRRADRVSAVWNVNQAVEGRYRMQCICSRGGLWVLG